MSLIASHLEKKGTVKNEKKMLIKKNKKIYFNFGTFNKIAKLFTYMRIFLL